MGGGVGGGGGPGRYLMSEETDADEGLKLDTNYLLDEIKKTLQKQEEERARTVKRDVDAAIAHAETFEDYLSTNTPNDVTKSPTTSHAGEGKDAVTRGHADADANTT